MTRYEEAAVYVGTDSASGRSQMELLFHEGLTSASQVLEVGCGALHAAAHLVPFLEPNHYVGIDPNEWLREASPAYADVVNRGAVFLSNEHFDASQLDREFDLVLAHSVLSHAAHTQLWEFMRNTGKVLAPHGRILASLRLAGADSRSPEWVYPGVTYFTLPTVEQAVRDHGLVAEWVPEHRERHTAVRPDEFHDWIVVARR